MKKILLSLLYFAIFPGVFAQSFTLSYSGGDIAPEGTIQILGNPSDQVMEARINIKNNSTVVKTVNVKKVIHEGDTLAGTKNSFCWGLCWSDTIYIGQWPLSIEPGQTKEDFYGDYRPNNIPGISRVKYIFFDLENREDTVAVTVEYNASPSSISAELANLVKFSNAYPNPAIETVNVDYNVSMLVNKASIVIMNMLGSKVKEVTLNNRSGIARIEVSDLINGIYFYSLIADDRLLLTRKFVVKR